MTNYTQTYTCKAICIDTTIVSISYTDTPTICVLYTDIAIITILYTRHHKALKP